MPENIWVPVNRESVIPETMKIINTVLAKIPQLSISVQKIIEMAGDDNMDSIKLAEVASSDPVLASKILMIVNSSYYSLSNKVDNLRVAIVLLGFNEVRNIAVQLGFKQVVDSDEQANAVNTKNLWIHSYLVSICAEAFSKDDDPKRAGVLMTMGILHDIGKFALFSIGMMMKRMKIKLPTTMEYSADAPLIAKEEAIFGVNHAIIGGLLTERWNLSERTREVLEFHHYPSFYGIKEIKSDYLEDIAAICIADLVVNHIQEEDHGLNEPHPIFFDLLGFEPPLESIITDDLMARLDKARTFINSFT